MDISQYLLKKSTPATAFVAFVQDSPVKLLRDVRGFTLQTQQSEGGGVKYFSKNSINN
jgi:hypothetical protein